ncbi:MAG: Na+/H+ antiporter subunit E [Hyphomicrobiaceae bacterium]
MAGDQQGQPSRSSGFIVLAALLTAIWIFLNSSAAIEPVITGVVISGGLAFAFTRKAGVWQDVVAHPVRLYHFISYTGIFLAELTRANVNMLRYVYSPRIEINPGIVKIKTKLKTPVGRLALANSITLTPGSLVVDIEGDSLFVHCLDLETSDLEEATRLIAGPFEEQLEKTFG